MKQKPNDLGLDRFEQSINQLKLQYDVFFNGGTEKIPERLHQSVNLESKRLFNIQSMTYAQSFRLNTLAGRLSSFNELWQRNLRMREQGRKPAYGRSSEPEPDQRTEIAITSEQDRESIDVLFQAFCRARERTGNNAPVDPTRFEELVTTRVRDLKSKNSCSEIVFVVQEEDGKVQLKTRAK
jgi:hypothetical protein